MILSVAIITYNEENNIAQCLEAISTIADEIIIVDNGSTDNTLKIARQFGAKIFQEEWKGYGKQKQSAIDKCAGDWILSIDADEVLAGKYISQLKSFLGNHSNYIYRVKRKNYCFGKLVNHCYRDDYPIRLFKKQTAHFNEKNIHETLETNYTTKKIPHIFLKHYTYPTLYSYIDKLKTYSLLIANQKYEQGKTASLLHIVFKPPIAFVSMYIFKGGFLDGLAGFIVSTLHSYYKFAVYVSLYHKTLKK